MQLLLRRKAFIMRSTLRCLVAVAGLGVATAGPQEDASTYVDAGDAARAAEHAALSAASAHQIAVDTSQAVSDAVAALHLTEDALREARADSDADDVGKLIKNLDSEEQKVQKQGPAADADKHKARLEKLEKRLKKLERRYNDVEAQRQAADDAEYARKLEAIRRSIQIAEYQLDIACGHNVSPVKYVPYPGPNRLEIDTAVVPHPGAVESFGTEGTAATLTGESVAQSDAMVDSIERAQAMEGKRSVYRALTHLRGATITAYDGIAHSHMKNVENYAKTHKWREEHPVRHLAEEESDTAKWAFPVHRPLVAGANLASAPAPAPAAAAPPAGMQQA